MEFEKFLRQRAKQVPDEITNSSGEPGKGDEEEEFDLDERNEFDEKLRKELETDEAVWSEQEMEYLKNNRTNMTNEELRDFLMRKTKVQEDSFERFTRAEEEVVMSSFPMTDVEEIAERIDRPVEEVETKIEMLGLKNRLE